ncbi:thioesterase family protein [Ilumatobacter sp.]|uniref:thioesterase family protein n=1 Tax=Ilumatobacter sp. TaxID=1967498 RepID=UPI003C41AF3A
MSEFETIVGEPDGSIGTIERAGRSGSCAVDPATTNEIHSPQDAMSSPLGAVVAVPEQLHGFGGLHGGIALAMTVSAISASDAASGKSTPPSQVRSVHAAFRRSIRSDVTVAIPEWRRGRTVQSATTSVLSRGRSAITVDATLAPSVHPSQAFGPTVPTVAPPHGCDEFALPPEFVPFGRFIEIRPTIAARPFAGGSAPTLEAWIRMRDDDTPIDLGRLIVLLDALAPSATATMTDFVAIPTVELTVRPQPALATARSPWMLLHAHSQVSDDGWVDERLDAWAPDGAHLGSASQLRLVQP